MKYAARWKVILHGVRMFTPFVDIKETKIMFDDKELLFRLSDNEIDLYVINAKTGDLEIFYSEDGVPGYLSEWAKSPMSVDVPQDFPLYELD